MSDLAKSWADAQAVLDALEGDTSDLARMRRLQVCDDISTAFYELSASLKADGRHSEADQAHSIANQYWSRVVAEVSDLDKSTD
jgi:hypothetical protein